MRYQFDSQNRSLRSIENDNSQEPFFTVISAGQFREEKEQYPYYKVLLHSLGSIRYCKAEVFKGDIIGTFRLPRKSEQRLPQLSFAFCLTRQSLVFIEDTGDVKKWV